MKNINGGNNLVLEKTLYRELFNHAFAKSIKVNYWDDTTESYGEGDPLATISIHKPIPISDLTSQPTLTLAEAYMSKQIEVSGSVQELIAAAYQAHGSFLTSAKFAKFLPKMSHSRKASKSEIQSHYDIGNDFYAKWLDPTMTYSCAYFKSDSDSLEEAQLNKVHHVLNKLDAQPGRRLVDIGSGWGTLIMIAAKEYGLKTLGVTLSQEQYDYTQAQIKKEGLESQVEVRLMDYRDLKGEKFDYVTSIGMFEHVGKENLAEYLQVVKDILVDNGVALIHGITGQHKGVGVDPFLNKYIFPGGYIPNVEEMLGHVMDAGLQLDDLEPLRRHYQKTLEIWHANFKKVYDQVIDSYGEPFARMWDLYLQGAAGSFEGGNIDVMQFLISNGASSTGLPMTRKYIYAKED
ncbi:MAG: cyclopropane-fatty-acyl-phospholipid synthase family protein [Oenococcus sp.]|uniref:class I SAM-dependent methyltransferase n=1 Tax=Oenococcus sp. TaxID=1979414 RepID=UPI0039EA85A3